LRGAAFDITCYFYNPNIHPVQEYYARLSTAAQYNHDEGLKHMIVEDYGLTEFTRAVSGNEAMPKRCAVCYEMRLKRTAKIAKTGGFDCFTSTLLYSKYQDQDLIVRTAEAAAEEHGVKFYYHDFREGWQEGIDESKAKGMYRQQYCGCIYSEEDRYLRQLSGKFSKKLEHLSRQGKPGK